jgi:phenylpropionate dioxygenase-like ring-hydroxylating dioxygenase large terminal subunit
MSSTKILKLPKFKTGAWLPVASLSELSGNKDMKIPVRVEIAGEKYAVWNTLEGSNGYKWSVVSDVCPHRNAPLSQGRIDPVTKCIECPYHGWQFDHDGECTKIPQLDDKFDSKIPPNTDVKSLPTYITGDMLWAFVPLVDGQYSNYDTLPDEIIRILPNVTFYTSRELPYIKLINLIPQKILLKFMII